MLYCLDTNVFFTPSNFYYPMSTCPAYWEMIDKYATKGTVFILDQVYQELTKGISEVSEWVKERKNNGWVYEYDDEATQIEFKKIANHVQGNYKPEVAAAFLSGADPWLIAVCRAHQIVLVTKEVYKESKKKVQIPNICKEFDVEYIDEFEMMRRLNVKFVLE